MKNIFIYSLILLTSNLDAQVPATGLVAYYLFSGNAADSSGNGHHGTVNGASLSVDRFGNPDQAYAFNGTSNYIAIPDFNTILLSDEISISFWAISNQLAPQSAFLLVPDNINDRFNIHINYDHNGSSATFWDYGNIFSGGRLAISPDPYVMQWNHYVFISSASQNKMAIYRNGSLVTSATQHAPLLDKNKTLNIGGGVGSGPSNFFFHGSIDDVAIYNRELTALEVQQIYQGCNGPPAASISCDGNTTFCKGADAFLVATPATFVNYQWQKNNVNIAGAVNRTYAAKATGNYRCLITNGCGSSYSNTIHTTALPLVSVTISASAPTTFCAGGSVTFNASNPGAGYAFQWYKGNFSIYSETGLSYTAFSPGTYKLVTTNISNSCSKITNAISVIVNCRLINPALLAGSVEQDQDNDLIVFPNPTSGSFSIQLNTEENTEGNAILELFNVTGQKIFETSTHIEKGKTQDEIIFGNEIINGFYILKITVNNKSYQSKVLIN